MCLHVDLLTSLTFPLPSHPQKRWEEAGEQGDRSMAIDARIEQSVDMSDLTQVRAIAALKPTAHPRGMSAALAHGSHRRPWSSRCRSGTAATSC